MSYVVKISSTSLGRHYGRAVIWSKSGYLGRGDEGISHLIGSATIFDSREEADAAAVALVMTKHEYIGLVEVRKYDPWALRSYAL